MPSAAWGKPCITASLCISSTPSLPKLFKRGDSLFGWATPEHNAPMRCVTEFVNASGFRDQEFHIAVVDHVSDLIGAEHGMDRNKDRVGPKHPQDRNDLIEGLLHADADAITR